MTKFISTAYGPPWEGIQGTGTTATGVDLRSGPVAYIVAADPAVLPMHTKITVSPNPFSAVVVFRVEDTGSAINGNHIDFYDWRGRKSQLDWGTRYVDVTILGKATTPVIPFHPSSGAQSVPGMPQLEGSSLPGGASKDDYSELIRVVGRNVTRGFEYVRRMSDITRDLRR